MPSPQSSAPSRAADPARTVDPAPAAPSTDERWSLLLRIAASEQLSRSARLRDFLLYVGKQSLKPNAAEIHEQEIGSKVFGRAADYDRSQDNIVRVNATELRRRISTYFETAGAQESLLVEIPRGGYTPVYSYRARATGPAGEPRVEITGTAETSEPQPRAANTVRRWPRLLWPLVCLLLAVAALLLYLDDRSLRRSIEPWNGKPAVATFWKHFLDPQKQTDLVMPDDSLSLNEDITNSPVSLYDYVNRNFVRQLATMPISADRRSDAYEILSHNLVTFGAIRASQQIQAQFPPNIPRSVVWTRMYTADELKRNNVVLIGGQKANPWVHLFEDQLNFVVDYDDTHRRGFVRNRHPKANEQPEYLPNEVSGETDAFATYSVLAYLPNPSGTGHVLILAGIDSDATAAAAEFLGNEQQMERLRAALHQDGFPGFEALLRVSRLSGTSLHADLIGYRIHP